MTVRTLTPAELAAALAAIHAALAAQLFPNL